MMRTKTRTGENGCRGFGLIEVLVSLGLLVMTFILATPLILSQRKALSDLTTKSHCSLTLNNMMSLIESEGGLSGSLDFDQSHNQFVVDLEKAGQENPNYKHLVDELIDLNNGESKLNLYEYIIDGYGGVVVRNHQMIMGSVGLLALMYNSPSFREQEICSNENPKLNLLQSNTPFTDRLKSLLPRGGQDVEVNFAIVPYDIQTRKELACSQAPYPMWPRPRNQHGLEEVFFPNRINDDLLQPNILRKRLLTFAPDSYSQYGFVARLQLTYTDADGTQQSCTSNRRFEYPIDQGVVFLPREVDGQILRTQDELEADFALNFKPMGIKETFLWTASSGSDTGTFAWQKSLNRERCSQPTIGKASFDLDIKIPNHIEPGSLVLCRDLSLQRAQADRRNGQQVTWCNGASNASVPLTKSDRTDPETGHTTGPHPYDHRPDSGWVPCDQLRVCNTPSSQVWSRQDFNSQVHSLPNPDLGGFVLRYETEAGNRNLWGCDVYVDMAVVDMAGNFLSLAMTTQVRIGDYLENGAAEIYFKTTDCYLCKKKRRGLGGAFGSFFNFIVLIALAALTVVSGGTLAPIFFGSLTAACMFMCQSNYDNTHEYTQWSGRLKRECEPRRRHKCKRVRAPSPAWKSTLNPTGEACEGSYTYPAPMENESFNYHIEHGDDLNQFRKDLELTHNGVTGWTCTVNMECNNGTLQSIPDDPNPEIDIDNFSGCSPIYVLTEVKEGGTSAAAVGNDCSGTPYPPGAITSINHNFQNFPGERCLISGNYPNNSLGVGALKGDFTDDNNNNAKLSYSPQGKICAYGRIPVFTYDSEGGSFFCEEYFRPTELDESHCFKPGEITYLIEFDYNQHKDLEWCESEDFADD